MRPELLHAHSLLRSGSPRAVEEAIASLQKTVFSFSMKLCGHPEDAQDTMQEALYRSLPHLAKIEDAQALAVWLYTVTRNCCWRMRRKRAGQPEQIASLEELTPDGEEMARLLEDAAAPSPETAALQAEERELLRQAVLRLAPSLRIVLVLHDMEDLTTAQAAAVLGLKPGTVRIRLHRGRLSVRQEMRRLLEERKGRPMRVQPGKRKCSAEHRAIFANLSEYLDGRMEAASCEQMRAHIEACPACVAFLRDLRAAIDRCRNLEVPCEATVNARLRAALTREYLRLLAEA